MTVHFSEGHFELLLSKSEVVIFNSFDYQTPEDFIYYVLFTAEQLSLNPENFPLELIGIDSEFF
jgi:hypothetical protein